MNNLNDLDLDVLSVETEYQPAPFEPGEYMVECVSAEEYISKTGNKSIKCKFKVCDLGLPVFHYFNIFHPTPTTKTIAVKQIAQFLKYSKSGVTKLTNVDSLLNHKCMAFLKQEPGNDMYGPSIKISYFVTPKAPAEDMPF